jgi:hypothetical protein
VKQKALARQCKQPQVMEQSNEMEAILKIRLLEGIIIIIVAALMCSSSSRAQSYEGKYEKEKIKYTVERGEESERWEKSCYCSIFTHTHKSY